MRSSSSQSVFEPLECRRLLSAYLEQDLVTDGSHNAAKTDPRLMNPWGIAVGAHGIVVADNATGYGTMYDGNGNNVVGSVHVPGSAGSTGAPTGVVTNSVGSAFLGTGQSVSAFLFVTLNGTVDAWTGAKTQKTASVMVDRSGAGAVYTGAAIGTFKHNLTLYVANFSQGRIDVFDSTFTGRSVPGRFRDPNLPANYVPFNVTNINGQLFVTYAEHLQGQQKETTGAGLGIVDLFGTDGTLIKRFATGGKLNAPWGVALAPSNFNGFSGDILIGNFGDGKVTAFTPSTGARKGTLSDFTGTNLVVDGLWGMAFGNGRAGNLTAGLYFAGGTNSEADGLYGRLIGDPNYPSAHTNNAASLTLRPNNGPSAPTTDVLDALVTF